MLKIDQIQVELQCLDPTLAHWNMKETYDCVICCLALFKILSKVVYQASLWQSISSRQLRMYCHLV